MNLIDVFKETKKSYFNILIPSLSVLFSIIIALLISYLNYTFLGLLIFIFLSLPLLYALLLFVHEQIINKDLAYNNIYKLVPLYFSRFGGGIFSVILNGVFCFLIYDVLLSFYLATQINIEELTASSFDLSKYQKVVEEIMATHSCQVALMIIIFIITIFLFYRIISRFFFPFINTYVFNAKIIYKNFPINEKKEIRHALFINKLPILAIYVISLLLSGLIIYLLTKNCYLTIIISLIITLCLSFIYLPFYIKGCEMIVYCFSDEITITSKKITLDQIYKRLKMVKKDSEEEKKLKDILNEIANDINEDNDESDN